MFNNLKLRNKIRFLLTKDLKMKDNLKLKTIAQKKLKIIVLICDRKLYQ